MSTPPRGGWLDPEEAQAWRGLISLAMLLPQAVDAHLKRTADLTNFDWFILATVSEAPGRSLPLGQLAAAVSSSPSRLSHAARRLEGRGLLVRRAAPGDARSSLAVLTDAGWELVRETAPAHVEEVRRLVFDGLDAEQVAALAQLAPALAERLRRS